jgi:adenylate cyclase class 2
MNESIEVEVKIPIENRKSVENALHRIGAQRLNSETQVDVYFDHPARAFQETDEALRLRSRHPDVDGDESDNAIPAQYELTYKGPKLESRSKSRVELSVHISNIDSARSILENLGFKYVATISKRRVFYTVDSIAISVDDVEDVGLFLELERVVASRRDMNPALDMIFNLIERLGLDSNNSIKTSYLELFLQGGFS